MNRCEEVLAKKKNPLLYDEKLRHSETYMGVEFSEDLTHWRYIRKYRNSKGKWTYVYANKETHNDIQRKYRQLKADNRKFKQKGNEYETTPDGEVIPSADNVKVRITTLQDMISYNNSLYNNSLKNVIKQDLSNAKRFIAKIFKIKDTKSQRHNLPAGRQKNVTSGGNGVHIRPMHH